MGALQSKYQSEVELFHKKTDNINNVILNAGMIRLVIEFYFSKINPDELDIMVADLFRKLDMRRSILVKHIDDDNILANRRIFLNYLYLHTRKYFIIVKDVPFNRNNPNIYPYVFLSDSINKYDTGECVACYENKPIVLTEPCEHISLCVKCYSDWSITSIIQHGQVVCAMCNTPVKNYSIVL
jgi:hypothetical protein